MTNIRSLRMFAIYDLLTFIRWARNAKIAESISFIRKFTAEHFMVQMTWSLSIEQFLSFALPFGTLFGWRSFVAIFNRHNGAFMLVMPMKICTQKTIIYSQWKIEHWRWVSFIAKDMWDAIDIEKLAFYPQILHSLNWSESKWEDSISNECCTSLHLWI